LADPNIKSGPIPVLRPVEEMAADPQTPGEQVVSFAYNHLRIGDGKMIGKRMILQPFQIKFILAVFDNPAGTRYAYLSVAARNGKTMLMAVILLAFIIGPFRQRNIEVASGAMSRDQAALCYKSMSNILAMSPGCEGIYSAVPSSKLITGISTNASYQALSSDAKTGYGRSLKIIMLDEASQVVGPSSAFTDMLESRQGSYDDALQLIISTQASSDMDYFSVLLDSAERDNDPHTVSHVYAADKDSDLMDREQWAKANPGLGIFRSLPELEKAMTKAQAIPVKESLARNQFLNERTTMAHLAFSATIWKECAGEVDLDLFRSGFVTAGLDLSAKNDLTAAVLATEDEDGVVHVLPFVFCPTHGIEERARRDRAPYDLWVKNGDMYPIGGKTMDFDQIAEALCVALSEFGIEVDEIHYDKHMIEHFHAACDREEVFTNSEWIGVPQFFKDMGVRLASAVNLMTEGKVRHGSNPPLNMSASVAVAKQGREGVSSLAKDLASQRIDPVVAMVMALWPFGDGREVVVEFDVRAMVG
jgi:phage terminase large subunit-like protein